MQPKLELYMYLVFVVVLAATPLRTAAHADPQPPGTLHRKRQLQQTVDFAAGAKFGPPENAFKLVSGGGPLSSLQGTRTTAVKAGAPPSPPVFKLAFNPKRSDPPAPKGKGEAPKGSGRRLQQTVDFAAGAKFGPPENAFKLVSGGGPLSSLQGTRTTAVKAGAPPSPPVFKLAFNPKRSDPPAPKGKGEAPKGSGRRLQQTVEFAAGAKFGPPENAFKLVSGGGPLSSLQGTRTTAVKAGAPPSPPVFKLAFNPKRSDPPAPKGKGEAPKASGRRLQQTVDFAAGAKFGPPENAFKLVSGGGPLSSLQGTRTTAVKAGAPPSPPVFKLAFNPKRSDPPAPKGKGEAPKASGRRLQENGRAQF